MADASLVSWEHGWKNHNLQEHFWSSFAQSRPSGWSCPPLFSLNNSVVLPDPLRSNGFNVPVINRGNVMISFMSSNKTFEKDFLNVEL